MRRALTIVLVPILALGSLAVPAAASAEYFIPDGNSAVNQYTEGIPTGGGEKSAKGAGEKPVKPAQTIGADNTKELEQVGGEEGREVAEVAAETAPPSAVAAQPSDSGRDQHESDGEQKSGDRQAKRDAPDDASSESEAGAAPVPASGSGASGSGGFGQVLGAATGSSGGGIGALLPLALVATALWGAVYAWRQHGTNAARIPSK